METLELLGFLSAIIIGITLGLIGGGGSILTVPVLVYLLAIDPVLATAYSLFIVGLSSLVGGLKYARQDQVSYKVGIVFAVPSFITVYFTRLIIVPALPEKLFTVSGYVLTRETGILLLFAILMVMASISMIRNRKEKNDDTDEKMKFNYPLIIAEGAIVGLLTGMVGAGGGFLIIPALVILAGLPMKKAIGTSLLIIAAKSLIGFIGDVQTNGSIDWPFLLLFSLLAMIGIVAGVYFSKSIDGKKLKKGFGWFVLVMGSGMIIKELFMS